MILKYLRLRLSDSVVLASLHGQSLPKWVVRDMSASPPIATEERTSRDVSNVPHPDMISQGGCLTALGSVGAKHHLSSLSLITWLSEPGGVNCLRPISEACLGQRARRASAHCHFGSRYCWLQPINWPG